MNARRSIRAIAVALVLTGSFFPTATVAAHGLPEDVTITVHVDFANGTAIWSGSGAVADQGTLAVLSQRLRPRLPRWTAHERFLFIGQTGTFILQQQARGGDLSPILSVGRSQWTVRSGTGAYADIRGQGTGELVFHLDDATLDVTLVGQVLTPPS